MMHLYLPCALIILMCIESLLIRAARSNCCISPAFRHMRVPLSHLNSTGRVLSGFNGATTLTMDDIALSVKAGPVTQQVLFSEVEDLGPYNAIIGRTWLHTMKAIPSTYHQSINYLTTFGQIDLQGSQLAARQCYQLSVHEREKGTNSSPSETQLSS